MNADEILFRASSIGSLMTNDRKGTGLGDTCKKILLSIYIEKKYGRSKEVSNKYLEKGIGQEEDAISLYSRIHKKFYRKNTIRLNNDFITGEVDFFDGEEILRAERTIDTKCSWDIFTFHKAKFAKVDPDYYWQGQSYMDLTGAKQHVLAYCLLDTPDVLIEREKTKLKWDSGTTDDTSRDYLQACAEIEKNMKYSDIPITERICEFVIDRNDADIELMHQRVVDCRKWMNNTFFMDDTSEYLKKEAGI